MWYRLAVAITALLRPFDQKISEFTNPQDGAVYAISASRLPWFVETPINKVIDWIHHRDDIARA